MIDEITYYFSRASNFKLKSVQYNELRAKGMRMRRQRRRRRRSSTKRLLYHHLFIFINFCTIIFSREAGCPI